ncbi:uncharacterized protein LOC125261526 [Megalobrama amblycephala]|uniref:uncharacterized protein LOC125261526 n=1 Tax=Megalobrama amblycephala TaxID=75352 RepID=UPI0020143BB4|nr:uncharacterized protein LOC125261526 [Megalobrama amblycephala]
MRVLFLFASLCLPSLIMSDFKEMVVNCTTQSHAENCNHTNSCEWNNSLAMCSTLQIQCLKTVGKSSQKKICSSLEECGLKKGLKFIETLLGSITCKNTDGEVKCSLAVACNQSIYLCEKAECELDHILSGSKHNKRYCKFHHNIAKCIKENGKFQGPINCTMKSATASNNDLGPNTDKRLETVILRFVVGVLGILIAVFLVVLCWRYKCKICKYGQDAAEPIPQSQGIERERDAQSSTINSPPTAPLLGVPGVNIHDAAMPISQHQDAEADSSLDDPQANAAEPIPQSQDGTLQMESSC